MCRRGGNRHRIKWQEKSFHADNTNTWEQNSVNKLNIDIKDRNIQVNKSNTCFNMVLQSI